MQLILSSLLLSLLFTQAVVSSKKTDKDLAHLVANPSLVSVQQSTLTEEAGKWVEGKRETVSSMAIDEQGRMKEFTFNPNSRSSIKREYAYDAEGNRQEKLFQYRVVDEATNKCELIGEPRLFNVVLKFDNEGNRVGEEKFAGNGNVVEKKTYKFDAENNADELAINGTDHSFLSRCVEAYDKQDRPVEKICYNEQGAIIAKETYDVQHFDSKGNWVKRIETIWQMKDGKLVTIGKMATYRTIHYHPPVVPVAKNETPAPAKELKKEAIIEQPSLPQATQTLSETSPAKAVKKAEPVYPSFARNAGISGLVVVEVAIDEKGKVTKAEAVSGPMQLRQAAIDAAKRWEYQPATADGKPLPSTTRITFNFMR
jgi:TonB family protein